MKLRLTPAKEPRRTEAPAPAGDPGARLRESPLFDAKFYAAALEARGGSLGGLDPIDHYLREGDAARIAPHPLFDPAYYAECNADVVAAGVNLLQHYLENGHREGRNPHPLIDLKLIRSQLAPDFAGDPLVAYTQSRGAELKPHRLVDPAYLAAEQRRLNPRDDRPALIFYLASDPEAVNPSADFDGLGYRRLYPEAAGAHPLVHYARLGEAAERQAPRDRGPIGRVMADIEAAARLDPDIVKPSVDPLATPLMRGYDLARRDFRLWN